MSDRVMTFMPASNASVPGIPQGKARQMTELLALFVFNGSSLMNSGVMKRECSSFSINDFIVRCSVGCFTHLLSVKMNGFISKTSGMDGVKNFAPLGKATTLLRLLDGITKNFSLSYTF